MQPIQPVYECVKCGVVTPVRYCPNCLTGTVWKHTATQPSGGSKGTLTHFEADSTRKNRLFDALIIVLSVAVPIVGLLVEPMLAAVLGICVGLFNWFLAPYAKLRVIQIMDRSP